MFTVIVIGILMTPTVLTPTVASVVQKLDSTIHQIEIYVIYPVNSVMHLVQQLGSDFSFIQYSQPLQ